MFLNLHQGFKCQMLDATFDDGIRRFLSNSQRKNEQDNYFIFKFGLKRLTSERSNGHEDPSEHEQLGAGNKDVG